MQFCLITNLGRQSLMVDMFTMGLMVGFWCGVWVFKGVGWQEPKLYFDICWAFTRGRGGGIVGVDCGSESGQVGEQNQMLCYCTCMSLNLADVINFVVAARHDGCRWWWWWCQWLGMRDGGRQLWIVNGCEKKGKRNVGLPTCRWFCLSQNGVV